MCWQMRKRALNLKLETAVEEDEDEVNQTHKQSSFA
jgi:hypothetical protein